MLAIPACIPVQILAKIMGVSAPSLHIESTDSMIESTDSMIRACRRHRLYDIESTDSMITLTLLLLPYKDIQYHE